MNGVMIASVSAGSSQRDASVMCTPKVTVPSGAAEAGRGDPKNARQVMNARPSGMMTRLMGTSEEDERGHMMPQTPHLLALGGALFWGLATIWIRQGLRGSDPYTGFFVNVVVGTVSLW